VTELRVLPLRVAEFPSRHDRHHEVQQDYGRPAAGAKTTERLETVTGALDVVSLGLQKRGERAQEVGIVLDEKYPPAHTRILLSKRRRE
jgi:hypothetical protein